MLVSLSTGGNGVNGSRIVPQFLWPCRIHVTAPTFTKRAENSWLSLLAGLPLLLSFCCLIYRQSSTSNKISSQKSISHYFFFFPVYSFCDSPWRAVSFLWVEESWDFHAFYNEFFSPLPFHFQHLQDKPRSEVLLDQQRSEPHGHHAQQSWFCGLNKLTCWITEIVVTLNRKTCRYLYPVRLISILKLFEEMFVPL